MDGQVSDRPHESQEPGDWNRPEVDTTDSAFGGVYHVATGECLLAPDDQRLHMYLGRFEFEH